MHISSIKTLLRESGLKVTPIRLALLNYLSKAKKPLSVEDLMQVKSLLEVDKVTLYRNLDTFVKKGIIQRLDLHRREAYFEMQHKHGHHHHIICMECGLIEDMHSCSMDIAVKNVEKKSKKFSKIIDHSMEFYGLCKKCDK
ncbi:transcriptional repressor [Candidatus Nomurabacteria bacterium]|nr:transcriptional repressor [Candidatus Nomurabacteria bacterium]